MSQSPFPGPIAPQNNPPINPQYYQPRSYEISAIELGVETLVTTSVDHDYVVGQAVRLIIPAAFGSIQLNGQQGLVISVPEEDQVLTTIDSAQNVNAYIASPSHAPTKAQILAIGDVNTGQINTSRTGNFTYIPGSFIDISPA